MAMIILKNEMELLLQISLAPTDVEAQASAFHLVICCKFNRENTLKCKLTHTRQSIKELS